MKMHPGCALAGGLFIAAAVAVSAGGGPINPPAGAVAPTAKPLSEIEPRIAISVANTPGDADSLYKITQPGSYYLTGNVTGVAGKHGIEIASGGVTLDLNGFTLVGVAGMGAFDGVSVTVNNVSGISVRNGSSRGWGHNGVHMGQVDQVCVEDITSTGNAAEGIHVYTGIVSRCVASGNNIGIFASTGSTLVQCSALANTSYGILASGGCTLSDCSATNNFDKGIMLDSASTMRGGAARGNGGVGITAYISTCIGCSSMENYSTGIELIGSCTASACTVNANTGPGIAADNGCTIVDCTAAQNTFDGITCVYGCLVRGNNCNGNGNGGDGAGIHATGSDNRIDGNNCTGADRGVDVDAAGNFIVRNTCSGNTTDWDLAAGNAWGTILDRRALGTPAVSGFSAPGTLGSTDANANFSY